MRVCREPQNVQITKGLFKCQGRSTKYLQKGFLMKKKRTGNEKKHSRCRETKAEPDGKNERESKIKESRKVSGTRQTKLV